MRCIFSSIDVTVLQCGLRMTLTTVVRVSRCILFLQGDALSTLLSVNSRRDSLVCNIMVKNTSLGCPFVLRSKFFYDEAKIEQSMKPTHEHEWICAQTS